MYKLVFTCEHGGNQIPPEFNYLFKNKGEVLESHKGWDPGALTIFKEFANRKNDFHLFSETSRLLVELNRSEENSQLFSIFTSQIDQASKWKILNRYYYPFRNIVSQKIDEFIISGFNVLHLSIHTFAPELNGEKRDADTGILFDPNSNIETKFAEKWKDYLLKQTDLNVKFNYPYLGTSDGHTTFFRNKYGYSIYAGLELEVNQNFYFGNEIKFRKIINHLVNSFYKVYDNFE